MLGIVHLIFEMTKVARYRVPVARVPVRFDRDFGVDLDLPFAVVTNPGGGGVVAAGEVGFAAGGFAGCGVGKDGDVG